MFNIVFMLNEDRFQTKPLNAVSFCAICLMSLCLSADTRTERDILQNVIDEIAELEALVSQAEELQNPNDRIRFRYDWLRQDLQKVQQGINSYITEYNQTPRSFKPLQGDYTQ